MPALAIKISAELADSAREEAEHSDRSLTGQIEHWAKLGRAFEATVSAPVALALKRSGGDLEAIEDPASRKKILEAIARVHAQAHYAEEAARLRMQPGPRYEADPLDPTGIIQVHADGRRVRGHLAGRKFVPRNEGD